MQGAYLGGAQLQDAYCATATFHGAAARFATFTCEGLTQAQLEGVIGNDDTVLPPGLSVESCWPADSPWLAAFIDAHGDRFFGGPARIREAFECAEGEAPRKIWGPAE